MKEFELKYGCNPNQKPARIYMHDGSDLPVEILNGRPGYINFLDAFNSWQLVRELKLALGLPAATSFKHVSPTSAAVGLPLSDRLKRACFVDDVPELDASALACVAHFFTESISHMYRTVQVGIYDIVPVCKLFIHVKQLVHAGYAGVIDKDIDIAEFVYDFVCQCDDAL